MTNGLLDTPEMLFAEEELRRALVAIFERFVDEDTPIASIHSAGYCEDGKTLLILIDLVDTRTVVISLEPGRPIAISVVAGPDAGLTHEEPETQYAKLKPCP